MIFLALCVVVAASLVIWKACDYFEAGSSYLGRDMPAGIRGATINAIGSSLPELLTGLIFISAFNERGGFSAAVATCAGSAVFNMVIIPTLILLAVTWKRRVAPYISLDRRTLIRDGTVFVLAELLLILMLGLDTLYWWMGGILMCVYLSYFAMLWSEYQFIKQAVVGVPEPEEPEESEEGMTNRRAWKLLTVSSIVIGGACYGLCWSVVELAEVFRVPAFLTAVVFAAAATSVPDTVLSLKDALKGNYDDAVSNAIGSNIFDITICLGLPMMIACFLYGPIELSVSVGEANIQALRIGLLVVTAVTLTMLYVAASRLTAKHGFGLLGLFGAWIAFLFTLT